MDKKGSGVFVHEPLGRPRTRIVDSIPNRVAMRRIHVPVPKDRPQPHNWSRA